MDRMACVDLPALPLQILLKRHPDWSFVPVAVIDRDTPRGTIRWVNEAARRCGVQPGMRYGAALVLAPALRAGEVTPADVDRAVAAIAEQLLRFTPGVEPCGAEPGVFWLDASGLSQLHGSLRQWATAVGTALGEAGWQAAVACGFTRFGVHAVARAATAGAPPTVVRDPDAERILTGQVPLDRLGIDAALCGSLARLGVRTVRAFLALPADGVRRRFGQAAYDLHQRATGGLQPPVQPLRVAEPLVAHSDFEHPETDAGRLLFAIKRLLDRVLAVATARHETLASLTLHLRLDRAAACTERLRPAVPTLDVAEWLNLVRLRLDAQPPRAGVNSIRLAARAVRPALRQPALLGELPRRDPALAGRALARVRAQFGDTAVVRARLVDAHLPEARFAWEPLPAVTRAAPRAVACRPLVRRLYARPLPLRLPPAPAPAAGSLPAARSENPRCTESHPYRRRARLASVACGPHVVSGGWWRTPAHREYYFAAGRGGDTLWVYYDHPRRRWLWQGQVE